MHEEHKALLAAEQTQPVLAEHAAAIKTLSKRAKEDIIEIGRRLADAKKRVGHGRWLKWLDREFGWTDKSAQRFIKIYEFSQADIFKYDKLSNLELPISALYLVAAPSTPDEARAEIIERAQAGESVPGAEIKQIIDTAKGRKRNPKPTDGNHRGGESGDRCDGDHGRHHGRDAGVAADIDELQLRLQRLESENFDLKAKIAELETAAAKPLTEGLVEGTASQLVDALESRLRCDGIEAAIQLRKIRDRIDQHKPQIDLKAMPALGAA